MSRPEAAMFVKEMKPSAKREVFQRALSTRLHMVANNTYDSTQTAWE